MLPTSVAHHHTVPVAKTTVASARTEVRTRSPPSIHQASATPRVPRPIATASWSAARPKAATNGSSTSVAAGTAGAPGPSGSHRRRGPGRRPGGTSSQAARRPRVPGAERTRGRAGRRRPATRSGCRGRGARGFETAYRASEASTRPNPTSQVVGFRTARVVKGDPSGPSATPAAPSTLRRRLPVTALGSGAPDRESTTDDAPRRGLGLQIVAILAIGLVFRLILGICDRRAPGIGVRRRPRAVQLLGRHPRQVRAARLLCQRVVCRLHAGLPVRAVAGRDPARGLRRGRAAPGHHRQPDQAAGDHHGARSWRGSSRPWRSSSACRAAGRSSRPSWSSSTRSRGSTRWSGARLTASGRCSCSSASGSCGAGASSGRPSSPSWRPSSSHSWGSSSRSWPS